MGYRPELSAEPQHDGFITYPLHEGRPGEHRTSLDKPSYCCAVQRYLKDTPGWPTPPVTPSVPKIAQLESNTATERAQRKNKDEPKKGPIGLPSTSQKDLRTGHRQSEEYDGVDTAPTATKTKRPEQPPTSETRCSNLPHLALNASEPASLQKKIWAPMTISQPTTDTLPTGRYMTTQEPAIDNPKPYNPTHEPQPDIYLQTPTEEHVKEFEAHWEPNPYALACGDTSGLWGIILGHYHLWASATATALCTLAQSDFRSQFYKTSPKKEPSPTLETPWSLVNDKANNDQKRSVSRRQASEDRKRARNIKAIPTASVSPSTPSQSQEILRDNDNNHQDPGAQEPTQEETAAPLRDNYFSYKNGNIKPPSTG